MKGAWRAKWRKLTIALGDIAEAIAVWNLSFGCPSKKMWQHFLNQTTINQTNLWRFSVVLLLSLWFDSLTGQTLRYFEVILLGAGHAALGLLSSFPVARFLGCTEITQHIGPKSSLRQLATSEALCSGSVAPRWTFRTKMAACSTSVVKQWRNQHDFP